MITSVEITDNQITGNLGNKLFIIAAMVGYAINHDDVLALPHWQFEKEFPNVPIINNNKIWIDSVYQEVNFHYNEIQKIERNQINLSSKIKRINSFEQFYLFIENITRLVFTRNSSIDLKGYFQSEKYFGHCKDEIRNIFNPSKEISDLVEDEWRKITKDIPQSSMVVVQVRRGKDYDNDYHGILPLSYYDNAFKLFEGYHFLLFSDDIAWCKDNFKQENLTFVDNTGPVIDMMLGAKCDHAIIPNSSFSWWTAWFIKNEEKKIVVPKDWFGPKGQLVNNTKDLYNEKWIVI